MIDSKTVSSGRAERRGSGLRLLWSFARPHRRSLIGALLLSLVASGMDLATPMIIKRVLDSLSGEASLAGPVTLLLALLVAGIVANVWQSMLVGTVAERLVFDARRSLIRRYLRAALLPLTRRPVGELVTRVTSDTVLLREAASSSVIGIIDGTVVLVGTLVMLAILDLPLLAVAAGAITLVSLVFLALMPAIATEQQRAQESLGRLGSGIEGALRALRTIKAERAEERIGHRVIADGRRAARHGIAAVRREAVAMTIASAGIQLALIGVIGFGGWRVAAGQLDVSTLIAFFLYSVNLLGPVMGLAGEVTSVQSGIAAAARIREIEDLPAEAASAGSACAGGQGPGDRPRLDGRAGADEHGGPARRTDRRDPTPLMPTPSPPEACDDALIRLESVTASYEHGSEPAVREVSLSVPRRGHLAIVGPSGAGKTTVFSLLLRFLEPDSGHLTAAGRRYSELTPHEVRGRFAYVEQDTPVVPGTIRENLTLARSDATDDELRRVLGDVLLAEHVDSLAEGLDTPLSAAAISGGQRQRIALARALLRTPDVLLLDEATAQIDAVTESAITACLRTRAEVGAVVTIAHRLSTVLHADRIVVMEHGRIRATGTHASLLAADELYRELVHALHIAAEPAAEAPAARPSAATRSASRHTAAASIVSATVPVAADGSATHVRTPDDPTPHSAAEQGSS
ncbi:ATP-binding cassette subfamily B protein [Actinoalloteichus hoggarensis]|uniref:Multidrug resistance ABC transporter ATP-binding and permease protein n=1 Tax=Actinoalloteichus hoggarensis TaxID=1470176 RepID=A0A221W1J8_9PSEU|nr:ABC transporter ATP-binding protein [Actinoalloteichus hoggarensis]ASO19619.1 Multidrug resistance ABC transporter ATP-binding and permease protein [Actinoalloteichus hoggarensis]MBB5919674.1 ATP-binding cassette subfamily B protein [Actinoalloteichus hoggarensis]